MCLKWFRHDRHSRTMEASSLSRQSRTLFLSLDMEIGYLVLCQALKYQASRQRSTSGFERIGVRRILLVEMSSTCNADTIAKPLTQEHPYRIQVGNSIAMALYTSTTGEPEIYQLPSVFTTEIQCIAA